MKGSSFIDKLIDREVRRIVAAEIEDGGMLRTTRAVAAIKRAYSKVPRKPVDRSCIAGAGAGRDESCDWSSSPISFSRRAREKCR